MAERGSVPGATTWSLSPMNISVRYGGSIAQGNGADWFGPLNPLSPIAPREVAGRTWDFPSGYNVITQPRAGEPVSFTTLRALADGWDLLRLVIETRKDQVARMRWTIKPRDKAKARKKSDTPDPAIVKLEEFWARPDGFNNWNTWLRLLLEDLFVIDAPAIYMQRTIGGDLLQLHPLDGATIKRVVDDWGRTPTLPVEGKLPTAYQQVLKGYPAIDYTVKDLIYRPRNMRTNKAYGYSPVEQVIMTVNIALRRQLFTLDYYTEGNIPESLIGVPDGWTPDQVKSFQDYWDNMFVGDLAKRRRAKFVPGQMAKNVVTTKEPELKGEFDEWLARVCCFAFSVSPTPFIKQMNRATASTQKEQSEEEGLAPILQWIKGLADDVIRFEMKQPGFEFVWSEDTEIDPVEEETVLTGYVKAGVITLDESRDRLGFEPYGTDESAQPMVYTANGYVPLTQYADSQERMDTNDAARADALANGGGNQPPAGGKAASPVDKLFGKRRPTKRVRRLAPLPFDRKTTRVAIAKITHLLIVTFGKLAPELAKQVRAGLDARLSKADDKSDIADEIAADLDLSGLTAIAALVGDDLGNVADDAAGRALAQVGVTDAGDLVNQVNDRAVTVAKDRGAELVGMRYDADGNLVENPDAQWAITDTVRQAVRDAIADGLDDNTGIDGIVDNIEALGVFSSDRADLIARTEVAMANSQAALEGYFGARDGAGVKMKKEWLLGPQPCVICQANADQGAIALEAEFASGDDAPPGHPNCECALSPVVEDDGEEQPDTEE